MSIGEVIARDGERVVDPTLDVMTTPVPRAVWDTLSDRGKGYVSYMQACWEGSEIPDERPAGADPAEWNTGRQLATMHAAEMEE